MKTLIIYFSFHHKNTLKILKPIARELGADLRQPWEVQEEDLENADLVGFASGIYFYKHHRALFSFINKLPAQHKKKAIIISTRGLRLPYQIFHWRLKRAMKQKGFKIIGGFSCPGWDTWGPLKHIGGLNKDRPNEKDIRKAKSFAQGLSERL